MAENELVFDELSKSGQQNGMELRVHVLPPGPFKGRSMYYCRLWVLTGWHLEDGSDFGVHGESFPHAHAEGGVDSEGVVLDADVVLQAGLGLHQAGQAQLRGLETFLQQSHGLTDLRHLTLQGFHYGVVAELDVDSACALIQSCLGNLHRALLVLDGLAQQVDVALHVEDLLHRLLEMGLQLVPGVCGLADPGVE